MLALRERPHFEALLEADDLNVTVKKGRARHIPDDVFLVRMAKPPPEDGAEAPTIDLRYVIAKQRLPVWSGTSGSARAAQMNSGFACERTTWNT